MHAFVELSCIAVWVPGISSVLDDRLAHLFSNHTFDQNTWIEGLIHISDTDLRLVKELTKVDQVDDPAEGFRAGFYIREILVK